MKPRSAGYFYVRRPMPLHDLQREVLVHVGVHLLTLQSAEHVIRLCLQIVLPKEPIETLEDLRSLERKESKKTTGYFLTALRARAALDPEFDGKLIAFLDARNSFIHNLSDVQGWSMRTAEGCELSIALLRQWDELATEVLHVFAGLLRAWELQSGCPTQVAGAEEFIATIDRNYVPKVDRVFSKKNA
jgi:hypothetical protein